MLSVVNTWPSRWTVADDVTSLLTTLEKMKAQNPVAAQKIDQTDRTSVALSGKSVHNKRLAGDTTQLDMQCSCGLSLVGDAP